MRQPRNLANYYTERYTQPNPNTADALVFLVAMAGAAVIIWTLIGG